MDFARLDAIQGNISYCDALRIYAHLANHENPILYNYVNGDARGKYENAKTGCSREKVEKFFEMLPGHIDAIPRTPFVDAVRRQYGEYKFFVRRYSNVYALIVCNVRSMLTGRGHGYDHTRFTGGNDFPELCHFIGMRRMQWRCKYPTREYCTLKLADGTPEDVRARILDEEGVPQYTMRDAQYLVGGIAPDIATALGVLRILERRTRASERYLDKSVRMLQLNTLLRAMKTGAARVVPTVPMNPPPTEEERR